MAQPNTFRNNVRERAQKEVNRRIERRKVGEDEIDEAADEFNLSGYNAFFADCRGAGKSTARCGALWALLKERGDAPTGDTSSSSSGGGGEQTASGTTDDEGVGRMPAQPGPETVEDLEAEFRSADQVFLVVMNNCPGCDQAEDALSDWIDDGLIEVVNVEEDDVAADIVIETNLDALPALVMETDGRRAIV